MTDIERELQALGERVEQRLSIGRPLGPDAIRKARTRRLTAALGVSALLLVTAFGGLAAVRAVTGGAGGGVRPSVLVAAADATESAGTARAEFGMTMKSEGGFMSMNATASGTAEIDFDSQRSYMRFEMEGVLMQPSSTIELIQDADVIYTKMGTGDQWVKMTPSQLTGGTVDSFASTPSSPDAYLDQLRSISSEIEAVGSEEIDGVSTTRYRATIDPEAAASEFLSDDEQVRDLMANMNIEYGPMDVWVDGEGLVRRMDFDSTAGTDAYSMHIDFSMRLFDFGAPVRIQIPDPNDVVEGDPGVAFGSSMSATESTKKIPVSKPQILTTTEGFEGPMLVISKSDPLHIACAMQIPEWVRIVQVIESSSDESVLTMGTSSGLPMTSESNACTSDEPDDQKLQQLVDHPKRFALKLIGKGRSKTLQLAENLRFPSR